MQRQSIVWVSIFFWSGFLLIAAQAERQSNAVSGSGNDGTTKSIRVAIVGTEYVDDQKRNIRVVQKILEKKLKESGFSIYDLTQLKEVRRREFETGLRNLKDKEKLLKLRKGVEADLAVDYAAEAEFKAEIDLQGQTAFNYEGRLELRLIDLRTAEIRDSLSAKTNAAAFDRTQAGRQALEKAGGKVAEKLIRKLKAPPGENREVSGSAPKSGSASD